MRVGRRQYETALALAAWSECNAYAPDVSADGRRCVLASGGMQNGPLASAEKLRDRFHWFNVRAKDLESSEDWHGQNDSGNSPQPAPKCEG